MQFTDLAVYTIKISEDRQFRNGDSFININSYGNFVAIDFDNGDFVHIRFEMGKALIKSKTNDLQNRVVVTLDKVKSYLETLDLYSKVTTTVVGVPYLQKILA